MGRNKSRSSYKDEFSTPPVVTSVQTAIPAIVGYTEKAEKDGDSLINQPTRLSSLLEFNEYFGGQYEPETISVTLDQENNHAVDSIDLPYRSLMYDSLRLFFDNGGKDCYVISVGLYSDKKVKSGDETNPDKNPGLRCGVAAINQYEEPTLILFPDAVLLDADELFSLQQMAITQCANRQNCFSIFDLKENTDDDLMDIVGDFRDQIGINNLKYGAAYTPWLIGSYSRAVNYEQFSKNLKDKNDNAIKDLTDLSDDSAINELVNELEDVVNDMDCIRTVLKTIKSDSPTILEEYERLNCVEERSHLIKFVREAALEMKSWECDFLSSNLKEVINSYGPTPYK